MRYPLYFFSIVILTFTAGLMVLMGYWLLWPDNIVVLESNIATLNKREYERGEYIQYTFEYCKTRPMVGLISRALINDISINFTNIYSDLPVGCRKITFSDIFIPEFAPPGKYHVNISAEYQVNPIRKYIVNLKTEDFIVKE